MEQPPNSPQDLIARYNTASEATPWPLGRDGARPHLTEGSLWQLWARPDATRELLTRAERGEERTAGWESSPYRDFGVACVAALHASVAREQRLGAPRTGEQERALQDARSIVEARARMWGLALGPIPDGVAPVATSAETEHHAGSEELAAFYLEHMAEYADAVLAASCDGEDFALRKLIADRPPRGTHDPSIEFLDQLRLSASGISRFDWGRATNLLPAVEDLLTREEWQVHRIALGKFLYAVAYAGERSITQPHSSSSEVLGLSEEEFAERWANVPKVVRAMLEGFRERRGNEILRKAPLLADMYATTMALLPENHEVRLRAELALKHTREIMATYTRAAPGSPGAGGPDTPSR